MNVDLHFNADGSLKETEALDHFAFFDLPRALRLNEAQLSADFFALSRRFHPDFFVTQSPEQQMLSLDKTSALNNAYRVLRDPISRAEYLIELETGIVFGESGEAKQVPTELLSDVMDIRERIMDLQMADDDEREALLAEIKNDIVWAQKKQAETDSEINRIAEAWSQTYTASEYAASRATLVSELKDQLSQRRYFSGLIREIEKIVEN